MINKNYKKKQMSTKNLVKKSSPKRKIQKTNLGKTFKRNNRNLNKRPRTSKESSQTMKINKNEILKTRQIRWRRLRK